MREFTEQELVRREKAENLKNMGIDPFGSRFDVTSNSKKIKDFMKGTSEKSVSKGTVIIATVKGDIHDIGKNIVKLLLENYGFDVIDMGKDVPPENIVEKVIEKECSLVGLSALMTTTVPAMEETIRQLKKVAPWCKTVVGGAVLTKDYAEKIGADKYAKDAMETVRYAEEVFA